MGARGEEKLESESLLAARRWQFGAAVLDERSLTLSVDQQPVELERKPLEVLLHLLHHAGEVVTKDELLAAVWPGRVLSDSALTSCMHKLREALRDEQQEIIRTQHGYGYRLVAPVKVEASSAPAAPRFEFKAGDRPQGRPQWGLVERLGSGGHGEAWLARHDKTREARVFKFAADGVGLTALKREITLSRLLHDALGGRRDIVRIIDWNLEDAPYFIEAGWSQSGSLVGWAKGQGGADRIPLATRLELAAQIAEALAAAHSVGVLHKDLKPSNVLVELDDDGQPRIKLSDFGSGAVLDPERLEQMGITRMGFTQTVSGSSGTPMYLAPEVISGQPFTIQSDIYALGVVLYQLVVGDLAKPLAPGWERDVADELLREDIASAAEGHPEQRLGDAARIAQRLRSLDERRRLREAEHRARAEAEQARLAVERVKARRVWVRLTIAASVTGVAVSLLLLSGALRARDEAREAAATSRAVSEFLNKDVFAFITAGGRPLRNLEVRQLLDAASAQVEKRFAEQPEAAAQVHATLGNSYYALEFPEEATRELDQAMAYYGREGQLGTPPAMEIAQSLVILRYYQGTLRESLPRIEDVRRAGEQALGPRDANVLRLRERIAVGHYYLGEWDRAAKDYDEVLAALAASGSTDEQFIGRVETKLGLVLTDLGDFRNAEPQLRRAYERLRRRLGDEDPSLSQVRAVLANGLIEVGKYDEADTLLAKAIEQERKVAVEEASATLVSMQQTQGYLRLEQRRFSEAAGILEGVLDKVVKFSGTDQSAETRWLLGLAYGGQHRPDRAVGMLRLALASGEKNPGPSAVLTQRIRIDLADALRESNHAGEARAALAAVDLAATPLPEAHPVRADLGRITGMLDLAGGRDAEGREQLARALDIYRAHYPPEHWRVRRGALELNQAGGD